ncbi:MAG: LacI family transcriptional regulator [Lachnospiraceae bacterium]|nr:LacI family transcriptional regulator [Lachnospiraceae bacterium]
MNTKVTIYDIAREAGVSPSMVSRVYNQKPGVSKEKRERIQRLIDQYQFVPDEYAKSLKNERTRCIGIIASDVCNPFFARIISECCHVADKNGYTVFSYETHDSPQTEMKFLEMLAAQKMEAIILLGGETDWVEIDPKYYACIERIARHTPIITMGRIRCDNVYNVITDEGRAMRTLLEYLLGMGHRQILFLGGLAHTRSYADKVEQFYQTMQENRVPRKDVQVCMCGYEKEDSYEEMKSLLEQERIPSAVIAVNETVAIGAIRAIKEKGLRIPEDISVVCFDNSFISESMTPRLTAVGCSYEKFGQKLINTTLDAIDGSAFLDEKKAEIVESVFVIRESVQLYHGEG